MHQGDFIKARMKKAKITQEDLANAIGVSRAQVIKLLSRQILEEDTIGSVAKILRYLNISQQELPKVDNIFSQNATPGTGHGDVSPEALLQRISDLETLVQTLKEQVADLRADKNRLQSQLDMHEKKRDPLLEDGGRTPPAGRH